MQACKEVVMVKCVVFARLGALRNIWVFPSPCVRGSDTRFCRKTGYFAFLVSLYSELTQTIEV